MNFFRMTISWREREHSAVDQEVMEDRTAQNVLRNCGLFKFFKMPNMKSNVRLLEMLVNYWEPDQDCFIIDQMPLRIEVEDIYFITGLSRRGDPVDLHGKPLGGLTVEDYVQIYCIENSKKVGTQIAIRDIRDLHIKILLFTIGRVAGSASLHQASRTHMSIAVECLIHVYDWCTALLLNMKQQLTSIRKTHTKHFGYGTILTTFFFERVPALRPKVISTISSPRDPRIARWADMMKRLGGSEVPRTTWDDEFFLWWGEQIIAVDDYPYAGMDFRGDPDLVLPLGATWCVIGKIAIFD